ncbi:MAG: GNAT family N-acetyltransferase [Dongiaceae bacterium]
MAANPLAMETTTANPLVSGSLEVRLAKKPSEIAAAQNLRYKIFYEEQGAKPTPETVASQRDVDKFDAVADHLIVVDHEAPPSAQVIATYRLIRRHAAAKMGGFYTSHEYDIDRLVAWPGEILEVGRSCVAMAYRGRPTMQLLWRGIAAYVFEHKIEWLFGCASFPGVNPAALSLSLSYLYHHHLAPKEWRPRALPALYQEMNRVPKDQIDPRTALGELPMLIKGYLRLGGYVGDGAVIDQQFNTVDVCVLVKMEDLAGKYFRHYERALRDVRLSGGSA